MADDGNIADILDALSPVKGDVDEAATDRAGTMAKLLGPAPEPKWYEAQNNVPPPPTSQNGNPLPPGLNSRQAPPQEAPQTPAVPAGVTPSGSPSKPDPSTLATSNTGTINLMQNDYARASQDVQNEAAQPDEATVTAPLERQRVTAQQRQVELQNPYDPKTGKMLDEYKPSFGQRFMRGVAGLARGGVLGAVDPSIAGVGNYGAPNKQYGIDQTQAAGRVAGADQQLKLAQDNWKAQNERLKQIATDRRALATTGKDVTGAAVAQQGVPIDQQKADADTKRADDAGRPKNYEEAVIAANTETDPTKRAALMAAAQQMKDTELRKFAAQRPAGERPSAQLQQYGDWKAAFTRDNKRAPTAAEIQDYTRRSGKVDPGAPEEVGAIVAQAMDAKQKYANSLRPQEDGTYLDRSTYKPVTAQQFQTQIDKLGRSDPNVKLAKKGYTIDETGQVVKIVAPASTPAATPPPAPAGATDRVYAADGKTLLGHMVKGKYVALKAGR